MRLSRPSARPLSWGMGVPLARGMWVPLSWGMVIPLSRGMSAASEGLADVVLSTLKQ